MSFISMTTSRTEELLQDRRAPFSEGAGRSRRDRRRGLELASSRDLDLILLDRNLSSSSGDKVLQDLGVDPTTAKIPVVIVTGEKDGSAELVERGAKEVLLKPYDVDTLVEISRALSDCDTSEGLASASRRMDRVPRVRRRVRRTDPMADIVGRTTM